MVSLALNEKSYFERNVIEAFMLDNPKVTYQINRIYMKNYHSFMII
jgi:hypothetical protein